MLGRPSAITIELDEPTRIILNGWLQRQKTPFGLVKRVQANFYFSLRLDNFSSAVERWSPAGAWLKKPRRRSPRMLRHVTIIIIMHPMSMSQILVPG